MKLKVCTAVFEDSLKALIEEASRAFKLGSDFVELRLDYMRDVNAEDLKALLGDRVNKCVLTVRRRGEGGFFSGSEEERLNLILSLTRLHPAFIDLELSAVKESPLESSQILRSGVQVMVSWHDFQGTPSRGELLNILREAARHSRYVKIVTEAKSFNDNVKILSLYREVADERLIAFCMGEKGIVSRVVCSFLGSPFTYASFEAKPTAPGQPSLRDMLDLYAAVKWRG